MDYGMQGALVLTQIQRNIAAALSLWKSQHDLWQEQTNRSVIMDVAKAWAKNLYKSSILSLQIYAVTMKYINGHFKRPSTQTYRFFTECRLELSPVPFGLYLNDMPTPRSNVCTDNMANTAMFSKQMLLIRYLEAYLTSLKSWKISSRLK
jgi:hypothetical protein